MNPIPFTMRQGLLNLLRGGLMGAADIVPGVSGGTVALILGIYQRLVTAISRFDAPLLKHLTQRSWRQAAERIDLWFLVSLATGIGCGIVALAGIMHTLLEDHRQATFAAFFGMILASGVLVGRMCRPRNRAQVVACLALAVAGAWGAWWIVSQAGIHNQPGHGYTFVCGMIGICAMILPGVSGSYLLLLLDKYEEITGIIKALPKLQATPDQLITLAVFAGGCAVGLVLFSKLLRWLLTRFHSPTMAVLCGFMIGSLWKVWPFQQGDYAADASLKERAVAEQPYWPAAWTSEVGLCLTVAVVCCLAVLAIDALAKRYVTAQYVD